jgi:hypothetical protein
VAAGEEERRRLLSRRKPLEKRPKRVVGGTVLELSVSGKPLVDGIPPPAHFSKNRVKKTNMQDFSCLPEAHTFFAKNNNFLSHKANNLQ